MNQHDAEPPPSRRPRLRLRLWTFMVVIIPTSAWLAGFANHARVQALAERAVAAAGGSVSYDNDPPPQPYLVAGSPAPTPPVPPWHARLLGVDCLRSIDSASVDGSSNPELAPAALTALADCRRLRSLDVHSLALTDDDLEAIGRMTELRKLYLARVDLTKVNIAPLANLRKLDRLDITNSKLDDRQLAVVGKLTQLESLRLGWMDAPGLSDDGVEQLRSLVNLNELELNENPGLTGYACAAIAHLKKLTRLDLDGTQVDDFGADALATLPNLYEIRLERSRITDLGLRSLRPLKKLFVLRVDHCPITRAGADELAHTNPGIRFLFTSLR